ncbi:MAG: SDR family oxidoreductase [Candidatus Goldiibacteriota bacterium]
MAQQRIFSGQTVLVTGGSSGIGRAASLLFANEGAKVIIADLEKKESADTLQKIKDSGGNAEFYAVDVSRAKDVKNFFEEIRNKHGGVNCAFNNAGIEGVQKNLEEGDENNWDKVINVNLKGVWLCMKYEIEQMKEQKSGRIVNMSSVAGLVGFAGNSVYTAAKHGVIGLTKSAALECAKSGIRINAVCPAVIDTKMIERITEKDEDAKRSFAEMQPLGRMGKPEEVAACAAWLCSDLSGFVTGAAIPVDGGYTSR